MAATFVLTNTASPETILGFYTLSSTAIDPGSLTTEVRRKLPPYPLIPGTLIGRLASDSSGKGRGLGATLLIDALSRAYQQSQVIASFAIVVEAIDQHAEDWYQSLGFIPLEGTVKRLYMPMGTVKKLLKGGRSMGQT
jgi:predicted GNAT family N-acyltransferase